jgi:nitronate monooxygenase
LRNESAQAVELLDAAGVNDFEQFRPHVMGALAHEAYVSGDMRKGMLDFGPAAVFADRIEPMESIFDRLIDDADAAVRKLGSLTA